MVRSLSQFHELYMVLGNRQEIQSFQGLDFRQQKVTTGQQFPVVFSRNSDLQITVVGLNTFLAQ